MQGRSTGIALLATLFAGTALASPAFAADLVVIVHAERKTEISVEEIAQIYLKRRRFWEDGARVVPVNRDAGSDTRRLFDQRIFGAYAHQLVVHWNRQYFSGVLPPATLASDEAVKRFVAGEPLAIGYVHASAVDSSVRVVLNLTDSE
jgi:ABC-type phosphate transport system substrate-binding protein